MRSPSLISVSLMICLGILVIAALVVSGEDDQRPTLVVPEDVPGADVIVFKGETYKFDFTASHDNVGIEYFLIEFEDNGTPVTNITSTGVYNHTFLNYTQTWVLVTAVDEAGNKDKKTFSIDVAELVTSDTYITDTDMTLDHSIYFDNADIYVNNATVRLSEGVGKNPYEPARGEIITEALTITEGMPGSWSGYSIVADPNTKVAGKASIRTYKPRYSSSGTYMNYNFDDPTDLSAFTYFRLYYKCSYSYYHYLDYITFYDDDGDYIRYRPARWYNPYYIRYQTRNWVDITGSFDHSPTSKVYWDVWQTSFDMNSVKRIYVRFSYYYYYYTNYYYLDGFEFGSGPLGDHISEGTTTADGQPWDGHWSGFSESTDHVLTGSSSLHKNQASNAYYNYYYYFDTPMDFTQFTGAHFFMYAPSAYTSYSRFYYVYLYDADGRYKQSYHYGQNMYYYSRYGWCEYFLPMNNNQYYYGYSSIDFTRISYFRFYCYGQMRDLYLDGFEFTKATPYTPANADHLATSIYSRGGDVTVTGGSSIIGEGDQGGRVNIVGGETLIDDATFENMWYTEYLGVKNALGIYGGLEIYGDAKISDATFVNCPGPGLALFDGKYVLDQSTIDLSGSALSVKKSPMLIMGATNRLTGPYTIDLTGWALENNPVGTGALVMLTDCKVKVTVKVHENSVDNNVYAGIVICSVGARGDLDISVYSQSTMDCGSGLILSVTGPNPNPGKVTTVELRDSSFEGSTGDGAVISFDGVSTAIDISLDNCSFKKNSEGLLVAVKDATGAATVSLTDIAGEANLKNGVAIVLEGQTGNANVEVKDSGFKTNNAAGLSIMVRSATAIPGTSIDLSVSGTLFEDNMGYGLLLGSDGATLEADASLTNLEAVGNTGSGIGVSVVNTIGNFTFTVKDIESWDNTGSGMHIVTSQQSSGDLACEGRVLIEMDSCQFHDNIGNGVTEQHHFAAGAGEELRPSMQYELTARNITLRLNRGYGYYVGPLGTPAYGLRNANYEIRDSVFSDNDLAGLHIREGYNNNNLQGSMREVFNITNCTFEANLIGLEQYWNRYSYGTESSVRISQCTFKANEAEAVHAHGYTGTYSGESCLLAAEYEILSSYLDSQVRLDIGGAYDMNGLAYPSINVTIVNNTYRSDRPMSICMGAYYNSLKNPVSTSLLYRANVHEVSSTEDGLNVEMYGGAKLTGTVNIEDLDILNPMGHGIKIAFGTLHNSEIQRKLAIVQIRVTDVKIRNSLLSAIDIEERHNIDLEAYAIGHYSLLRVDVQSAEFGVRSEGIDGEIRDSRFFRVVESSINTQNGIIDVYDSDIGAISRDNLVANEYGAIRLWFSLQVKVVWKDSGDPVIGASLAVRDNTWSIIGVSIVQDADGMMFSNLNSITVDYLGIITRNPYIVNVEFRGIAQERIVNVTKRTELTVLMVDDILPRISIETPGDGSMQRERFIYLKGTSYDIHSPIDRVVVSIDGEFWQEASGQEVFEATIADVPEGLVVVLVRAYDASGNYREESISVLVDSTPPSLKIISPAEGIRTNSRSIEVVGTTDVGARVYINGQLVEIDYTFISKTVQLSEGPNVIKVKVMDLLGNYRETIINVILDTQAPYLVVISPKNGATVNTKDVRLMGHTESTGVTIQMSGLTVPVDGEGYFTVDVILEPGINHLEIVAVDDVGNERRLLVVLTFDGDPPWIKLAVPIPESFYNTREIVVAGYTMEGTRIFLNGLEIDVVLGQFQTTLITQEGHVDIVIVGIDDAGNEMSLTVPIFVDSVRPGLEIVAPVDGLLTNIRELQIEGFITPLEDPKDLELLINGAQYTIDMDGNISQAIDLADGVNLITIEVADLVGNRVSVTRTVTLDTVAPYLSVMVENTRIDPFLTDPVSLGTFVYVTGITETGTSLTINGIFVDVDPVNGHFNYTMDLPMPQEGWEVSRTLIRVASADEAGNTAVQEEWVNRLEGERTQEDDGDEENTVTVLVFALLILGLSIVIAVGYMRYRSQAELYEDIESHGHDASPPPEETGMMYEGDDEAIGVLDEGGEDEGVA